MTTREGSERLFVCRSTTGVDLVKTDRGERIVCAACGSRAAVLILDDGRSIVMNPVEYAPDSLSFEEHVCPASSIASREIVSVERVACPSCGANVVRVVHADGAFRLVDVFEIDAQTHKETADHVCLAAK